jgi:uncharacterized protein
MQPKGTVVALATDDVERALAFYRDGLGLPTPGIEDGILALELPNLTLFLIERAQFEAYARHAEVSSHRGGDTVGCILSCALASREEVDEAVRRAGGAGGTVPHPPEPREAGYTGYFRDPDGHLWELVAPAPS